MNTKKIRQLITTIKDNQWVFDLADIHNFLFNEVFPNESLRGSFYQRQSSAFPYPQSICPSPGIIEILINKGDEFVKRVEQLKTCSNNYHDGIYQAALCYILIAILEGDHEESLKHINKVYELRACIINSNRKNHVEKLTSLSNAVFQHKLSILGQEKVSDRCCRDLLTALIQVQLIEPTKTEKKPPALPKPAGRVRREPSAGRRVVRSGEINKRKSRQNLTLRRELKKRADVLFDTKENKLSIEVSRIRRKLGVHLNKLRAEKCQLNQDSGCYVRTKAKCKILGELVNLLTIRDPSNTLVTLQKYKASPELTAQRYWYGQLFRILSFGVFKSNTEKMLDQSIQEYQASMQLLR